MLFIMKRCYQNKLEKKYMRGTYLIGYLNDVVNTHLMIDSNFE